MSQSDKEICLSFLVLLCGDVPKSVRIIKAGISASDAPRRVPTRQADNF